MVNVKLTKEEIKAILWLIEDRMQTLQEDVVFYIDEYGFGSAEAEDCILEYEAISSASVKLEEAKNDNG